MNLQVAVRNLAKDPSRFESYCIYRPIPDVQNSKRKWNKLKCHLSEHCTSLTPKYEEKKSISINYTSLSIANVIIALSNSSEYINILFHF